MTGRQAVNAGIVGKPSKCQRCGQPTIQVATEPNGPIFVWELFPEPVRIGEKLTGPFFERRGEQYKERPMLNELHGYPIFAAHHCEKPVRCKQCEQVHTTSIRPEPEVKTKEGRSA